MFSLLGINSAIALGALLGAPAAPVAGRSALASRLGGGLGHGGVQHGLTKFFERRMALVHGGDARGKRDKRQQVLIPHVCVSSVVLPQSQSE